MSDFDRELNRLETSVDGLQRSASTLPFWIVFALLLPIGWLVGALVGMWG